MAPVPLEDHQTPVTNNIPQEGNRGGSISLGMLIDFIIQRTYHELTVLAELLPRKTDMERKIEIYNFSARTRQLYVRLLALVKWANSASKVDKSAHIMAFLDKQSLLFVDTADMLARMARETLVHARLPNFHIPAAVEVLTTGTYSRLPACIRERIVPPDPITPAEKRSTLQRLNQVIQHRLVTGNLLPQMRNLKIEAGRVTFLVEQEFSVSLTVMGDGPTVPWRLLELEILVSDRETGDGKALVHPLQTRYVHQVVQSRLADSSNPLSEVYHILHYFCQSLQLEVLYSQTLRLIRDRLDDHIHVDEYTPGKCLSVSYWRELTNKDPRSELGYKLTVQVDQHDPARSLAIVHVPSLGNKESEIADRAIRSDQLSMECLLVHTIYVRTRSRLLDLKQELQTMLKDVECTLAGSPAILSVPILQPCLRAEHLLVTVDTHTGMLQCHVPQYKAPLVPELTAALNGDHSRLPTLISELRFWITQRRCEKTLQHLPATSHERLPVLHHPDHPMAKISRHRMFVQLHRHPTVILIVAFKEKETSLCEIECSFHLAVVKHSSVEDDLQDDSIETEIPKMYLKVQSLIEFDTFVITHGPFTSVDSESTETSSIKRRSTGPSGRTDASATLQNRRSKQPAYFIPELAHVVALCDERIPFVTLAQELTRRDIAHQGLQVEANATALVLKLVQLPAPSTAISFDCAWHALLKRLLSVSIRVQGKGMAKTWMAEFVFYGSPLSSSHPKEQGLRRPVYFQYEMGTADTVSRTVDALLNDWAQIVHLYSIVHDLAEYFKMEKYSLRNMISIKSYNYSKLVLAYGPNRGATVTVQWNTNDKTFKLIFGKSPTSTITNAHSIMKEQLEAHLNRHRNLAQLAHILHETLQPLTSISKLPTIPQLCVYNSRPQVPVQTFTIMPQCVTLVRIAYQGMYCLELRLRGGGLVSLRDGAYSRFDRSYVVDEFTPTQGLKAFLSKYVDESAVFRRRSQSEDDNPPSPVTMDSDGGSGSGNVGFLSHHRSGPQSPAQQRDGLRFHPPLTPPSGSNPHTPASPHTTNISQTNQHQSFGSSPATSFNLASPPSLPPNTPNMLPHPSPGSGLVANSPLNPMHVPSPAGLMPTSSPGPCSSVQVGHSPAGSFMQTGHIDGSPFPSTQSMASPAASNWPGSPNVPRPSPARPAQSPGHAALHSPQASDHKAGTHISRVLPQRSWAGAVPTLLTHEALELLCCPSPHPSGLPGPDLSPLERFLGCIYMRRQFQRFIQTDDCLTAINSTEPGIVQFKVESLQCRVGLNPQHLQSLHIKVQPLPEHKDQWTLEELQIIEKFFDTRAAAPPYKPNTLSGFGRMLNVPFNVLKDFVQIMKLELVPGLVQQQQLKWNVQWCLRIPPSGTPIVPTGMAAVLVCRNKILFFLQITRIGLPYQGETPSLVLPLVYDVSTNVTQLAEKRDPSPASAMAAASLQLKRFAEYGANQSECSLFPAVRDLLANLTLPSEPPVMSQVVPSPAGGQVTPTQQIQSPAMQLHSPMAGNQGPSQGPYGIQGMPPMGIMGGPPQ
ncbi:mediator of RNA polymerase II transcription subunit 14 isoform X1 [Hylaeus anthracinus]|uniref:mediator of RNA polymerase II transcription subunit 14 isoform X1 n=2 Tax=Hylaeus volcanicus TaxID=313075 RepID=UPI0023B85BA6|nr:mediator of RNA polymerase II transcription subunit 14 isoform X1 [Hylaeus volcanicus]XP_053982531.1 mediator of RNA polymerase II transcription subunit 14 isoform X1 [Hylaeus volcanicus]XP_054009456.1 mediator of RNA polymerase II transcription subunit 14 isoform X1 [Hylaeus anthracinus]XP_054009457.1 mediator of RNA polymerase II transcription subunit 14 isoform X1 [Hylaeus anthracinus]